MAEDMQKHWVEEVGRLRVDSLMVLVVSVELIEERYGDEFIKMWNEVQNDAMLLCGNMPIEVVMKCMQRKFDDPTYSIKRGLIEAMKMPDQLS